MRRVFIHSNKKCEKNCLYCFSKWDNYVFPQICHNNFDDDVIAFYPTCDSDFEIDWKLCEQILKEYNDTKTIIFSFSCKGKVSDDSINDIIKLNSKIKNGYVKLSVCFTTKFNIKEVEQNTADYTYRIDLLKKLKKLGIKTSVILKPILPFVDITEYFEIINDTSFVNCFLTGGLYVNTEDEFYKKYIDDKYICVDRIVNWCNNSIWKYIEDSKVKEINEYIKQKGCYSFDSDECLLDFLLKHDDVKG